MTNDTTQQANTLLQLSDKELASYLLIHKQEKEIIPSVFNLLPMNCMDRCRIHPQQLDALITRFDNGAYDRCKTLTEIISLVRSAGENEPSDDQLLIEDIRQYIRLHLSEDISIEQTAKDLNLSFYYMCHLFKNLTGTTISNFRNQERIKKAKSMLISTDKKITDIAMCCGFSNPSYFTEVFTKLTGISPTDFRASRENKVYLSCYDENDRALADMLPSIRFLEHFAAESLKSDDSVQTYAVTMPTEEYRFLHEAAIIEYHGVLFASWYNNPLHELHGRTPIRGSRSFDGGKTWSEIELIADDPTEKLLYCPPVYGICHDKLYMLINEMVAPDHIHALDLFIFDEEKDCFVMLWSRPVPFKLNTNVYTLPNGKLMLPGRIGELDRFPNTPAVLISDNGEIDTQWRLVKIAENGNLPDGEQLEHPEISAILCNDKIYMFCRNDRRRVPLVYISEDNGEHWSGAFAHDIPCESSKIYSGTLSDGRNYLITNLTDSRRSKLAVFFSQPGTMDFHDGILLKDGAEPDYPDACRWHYPVAIEADGKLMIICTVGMIDASRGAVLITVPVT